MEYTIESLVVLKWDWIHAYQNLDLAGIVNICVVLSEQLFRCISNTEFFITDPNASYLKCLVLSTFQMQIFNGGFRLSVRSLLSLQFADHCLRFGNMISKTETNGNKRKHNLYIGFGSENTIALPYKLICLGHGMENLISQCSSIHVCVCKLAD